MVTGFVSLIGFLFIFMGYQSRDTEEIYAKNGVTAEATVTGKEHKIAPRPGGPKQDYSFVPDIFSARTDDLGQLAEKAIRSA